MEYPKSQNSLILRVHRLIDAFSKSDDERDFYLDRVEGFIIYVDLDKDEDDLSKLYKELEENAERYILIPKLTFYEIKKIMETFIHEKIYDIDTKEKFLETIQSKDAREQFLEFIYDHESELEKWQQFYLERSRIRIIEWLRNNNFQFVFEEDLDFPKHTLEQLKIHLFDVKVSKEVSQARQILASKAKTYYSSEALNPRPKRGRPPKQSTKIESESFVSNDIYTQVPTVVRRFLYLPDITAASLIFSEKYDTEEDFLQHFRGSSRNDELSNLKNLSDRFESLKELSSKLGFESEDLVSKDLSFFEDDLDDELEDEEIVSSKKKSSKKRKTKEKAK